MNRLLWANFAEMARSKRLWIGAVFVVAYDIINLLLSSFLEPSGAGRELDLRLMEFLSLEALLVPVICALFVNGGYQDGTIRNKLTAGHRRPLIYLANLVTVYLTGLIYMILHVLLILFLGLGLGGCFSQTAAELLAKIAVSLVVVLSLAALAMLVCALMTHRAVTVVVIFMAAFLLDGAMFIEDLLARPGFVTGTARAVLCTVNDLLPGGQIFQLMGASQREVQLDLIAWSAFGFSALVTAAGLFLFQRKDLK